MCVCVSRVQVAGHAASAEDGLPLARPGTHSLAVPSLHSPMPTAAGRNFFSPPLSLSLYLSLSSSFSLLSLSLFLSLFLPSLSLSIYLFSLPLVLSPFSLSLSLFSLPLSLSLFSPYLFLSLSSPFLHFSLSLSLSLNQDSEGQLDKAGASRDLSSAHDLSSVCRAKFYPSPPPNFESLHTQRRCQERWQRMSIF